MRFLSTFDLECTRQLSVVVWIEGEGEFLGLWECCDNVEMTRDEAVVDCVRLRSSIDVRIPGIFVEDVPPMSSSVLDDLCLKLKR
jgi:hypothetical protein